MKRQRSSVRFRITALAAVVVLAVLVATSVALLLVVRASLVAGVDTELARRSEAVAVALAGGESDLTIPPDDDESFAQIVDGSRVVLASPNIAGLQPVTSTNSKVVQISTTTVDELDDTPFRVISRPVMLDDRSLTLHVGLTLEDVEESTAVLGASLAVGVPLVAALLAGLVWNLVGRTLRDVEDIRSEVAAIGGSDLDRRIPLPKSDDEIRALAITMNEMLDRIETASGTLRQFVADASHELRSPLTRLRTQLEVDGAIADADELLAEVIGMQRLVEDLLYLARLDAAADLPTRTQLDLDDVVRTELRTLAPHDGLHIDADLEPVMVAGDPRWLGRAVRNVLENATRFADSRVAIQLHASSGEAVLTIADDGPGVPSEARHAVFDRFTQVDAARSGDGTGLGLSIASDIVHRHNGSIAVEDSELTGAAFVIRVPQRLETD